MTFGFDRPWYFLPFDHRASMQTKMFGWRGPLNAAAWWRTGLWADSPGGTP